VIGNASDDPNGQAAYAPVTLRDPAAQMFALTRLIAALEGSDHQVLDQMLNAGMTPDLLDRLRSMPLAEAWRFAVGHCGLGIAVDTAAMQAQFQRMDRSKADREALEYLVRHGASPRLLTQLFALTQSDARRLRRVLAPDVATGGRPRLPPDDMRPAIELAWEELEKLESCPRARIRRLHERFRPVLIASLELVIMPQVSLAWDAAAQAS
jgi:hypothetical protein